MRMWARRAAALPLLLASLAACGGGTAGGDGIVLEKVATIGGGSGEDALSGFQTLAFDGRGRAFVIARDLHEGMPFVLGPDGEVARVLAEPGEGPGELARPEWLEIDANDSVFVWDGGTGRMSVFAPELDYVRGYRPATPAVGSSLRLPGGDWVHASPTDHGYPFRLVSAEGTLLAEWGDTIDYVTERNGLPIRTPWVVGPGRGDTFWAVPAFFRLEARQFDATGTELRRLDLESEWHEPYDRHDTTTPDRPPQAVVTGVRETDEGLWIVGFAADPDWRDALGEPFQVEGRTAYRVEDRSRLLDAVIELRDSSSGELRARFRDDRFLTGMMAGDRSLVMVWREDELGFQSFDVFRVRYEPPGS